ncbi:MAG: 3-dehydroquinate synthase [Deltaproteobacteria bacterium]|nr:MAG: 3-dehydroquinate synthase [Deltaproteobacteria bacterium]
MTLRKGVDRSYDVLVGRRILSHLHEEIQRSGAFSSYAVVTDEHVRPLVAEPLQKLLKSHQIDTELLTVPAGEAAKSVTTVVELCQQLVVRGFDRQSLLLAVGGGVVGDIVGFAAAIYLRGIRYIQIPTTILAQVDSAIGGKTGVDLPSGKNLLGAFHQPLLVLCDPDMLDTLPLQARRDGLAEVIKTALIGDPELFALLGREGGGLLDVDSPVLETILVRACAVKCRVVSQDEHESGLRRILNFGHTLGHAVEAASNYMITHGQAVAIGMGVALQFSREWTGLGKAEAEHALSLINEVGLPTEIPPDLDLGSLLAALEKDKKIQSGICHFVLLSKIGHPVIHPIRLGELRRSLEARMNQ